MRRPAVAGLFYPADPVALDAAVSACLRRDVLDEAPGSAAIPTPDASAHVPDLRALVVPHAGYVYSGPTAGVGYRLLPAIAPRVRRVLLLGPPHRVPVWGLEVTAADEWESPLGRVVIDAAGRQQLVEVGERRRVRAPSLVTAADTAHAPEHSLEVQVPFLQRTLPGVALLPVLVGEGDPDRLADLLEHWWARDSLVVVSTDLSHYEPLESARRHDARTSAAVQACDAAAIGDRDACGAQALRTLLTLAARHGASVRELDRRTSADTVGDPARVVGYGAFAVSA